MEVEHLFYLLMRWVPFYVSLTCLFILLCSMFYKDAVPSGIRNLLMLLLGVISFNWLYTNLAYYVPSTIVPLMPLLYLCALSGAILFYHFIHRLTRLSSSERFSWMHYIIPILGFAVALYWTIFTSHGTDASSGLKYPSLTKVLPPLRLLLNLAYFIPGLMRIRRYRKVSFNYSSNEERASLSWLYLIAFIAVSQIIIVLIPTLLGAGESRGQLFNPFVVPMVLLIVLQVVLLTYNILIGNYEVISNEKATDSENAESKPFGIQAIEEETSFLKAKLEQYFANEKPYLKPGLKISDLTKPLQTNRTQLSAFINSTYNMNFCRFVNNYRLMEYERQRADADNQEKTNESLIAEAGFSNHRAYLRAIHQLKNP